MRPQPPLGKAHQFAKILLPQPLGGLFITGLKTANPWRLYDTLGNVSEWCWDCYGSYPPGSAIDYKGNYSHVNRVYRGATWAHPAGNLRAAYRGPKLATSRENKRGFRLARLLP